MSSRSSAWVGAPRRPSPHRLRLQVLASISGVADRVRDPERAVLRARPHLAWPLLLPGSNPGASTASAMQKANRWRAQHLPMQERPADIYAHAQGGGRIETAQSSEWRPRYAVVPGWTVRGRLGCAAPVRWQWPVGAVLAFVLALAKHRPGYRRRPAARDPAQAFCSVLSISSAGQPAVPHRRDTRRRAALLAPRLRRRSRIPRKRCRHCQTLSGPGHLAFASYHFGQRRRVRGGPADTERPSQM